ncbi:MAG TPA: hypothetical protein VMI52_04480 [Acetobacteraceae bacterium]|nr:hypothetical protein [Acetobacteraceae bacterium]
MANLTWREWLGREWPWHEEPGHAGLGQVGPDGGRTAGERGFVADTVRFRLVVRRAAGCSVGWRFLVLRRQEGRPLRLVGSGTAAILGAAMAAAHRMAEGFEAVAHLCEAARREGELRRSAMPPADAMFAPRGGACLMMA